MLLEARKLAIRVAAALAWRLRHPDKTARQFLDQLGVLIWRYSTNIRPKPCWVTETVSDDQSVLVKHVRQAFISAMARKSEVNLSILSMAGMSGKKYRLFINNLIRSLDDAAYLEVGSWAGSTLCSAINRNSVRATAIDNWSQFDGPKEQFLKNLEKFGTPGAYVNFIEDDFRNVSYSTLGPFSVYLFDGPHEYEDQYDGLILALPAMTQRFVFIVDDWNHPPVRDGTIRAIDKAGVKIEYSLEIRTTLNDTHALPSNQHSDWHNGYFIGVLRKEERLG